VNVSKSGREPFRLPVRWGSSTAGDSGERSHPEHLHRELPLGGIRERNTSWRRFLESVEARLPADGRRDRRPSRFMCAADVRRFINGERPGARAVDAPPVLGACGCVERHRRFRATRRAGLVRMLWSRWIRKGKHLRNLFLPIIHTSSARVPSVTRLKPCPSIGDVPVARHWFRRHPACPAPIVRPRPDSN